MFHFSQKTFTFFNVIPIDITFIIDNSHHWINPCFIDFYRFILFPRRFFFQVYLKSSLFINSIICNQTKIFNIEILQRIYQEQIMVLYYLKLFLSQAYGFLFQIKDHFILAFLVFLDITQHLVSYHPSLAYQTKFHIISGKRIIFIRLSQWVNFNCKKIKPKLINLYPFFFIFLIE